MSIYFSWDPKKAASNLKKHGIGFPEATTAFYGPLSVTIPDPKHSLREERFLLIGVSGLGRLVVVAHAERGDEIRLITARSATRPERVRYEEA